MNIHDGHKIKCFLPNRKYTSIRRKIMTCKLTIINRPCQKIWEGTFKKKMFTLDWKQVW